MEFLMSETKVYAILTAGYDRKERMEGRILGEELAMAGSFFLRKREKRYILERPCFLYNKAIKKQKQVLITHYIDFFFFITGCGRVQ